MTGAPAKEAAVMIGEVGRAGIELDVKGVFGPEEASSIDETSGSCRDDAAAGFDAISAVHGRGEDAKSGYCRSLLSCDHAGFG